MTKPDPLPPPLAALRDQIDACEREAESLIADLDDDQVNWQERPGESWSIAQCLDHLATINGLYVPPFLKAVEEARARGAGSFRGLRPTVFGRWFIAQNEPPVKRRIKTAARAEPHATMRRDALVPNFKASHQGYRQLLAASAHVNVNRVVAPNPFIKFVRMRIATVLQVVPAHDRRHLWQADRVKRALLARA